ncbi:MAG: D-glycero-beta-D-manno-heptose-7-phosphate kinase [Thermodesulfobacteriota bacterium]
MNYLSIINEFKNKKVLVIGDLMLDKYVFGTSSRISPEAPVPVISQSSTEFCLGGAANVAKNLTDLGAKTFLIGTAGIDNNAKILLNLLNKSGINTKNIIKDRNKPTTLKTRIISDDQQLVRIDEECGSDISLNIQNQILNRISRVIRINNPDAVIISDYNKGVITKKISREAIKIAKKSGAFVAVDPKGTDFIKYAGSNVITPNRKEAETVFGISISDNTALVKALRKINKETKTEGILITKGKEGVSFIRNNNVYDIPAVEKQVYDVTGAGDTFISVFTLSALCSDSWQAAAYISNIAASIVISNLGTTSLTKDHLTIEVEKLSHSYSKVKNIKDLKLVLAEKRKNGEKVVFTNGCFDILHTGHIKILKESREQGDLLIVALNSDKSVRKLKGKDRPVVSEIDRATMISSFDFVDYVVIFNDDTPINTIKQLKPDLITKGGDYKKEQVVGKKVVESYGGKVKIIPLEKTKSTSEIFDKIRRKN